MNYLTKLRPLIFSCKASHFASSRLMFAQMPIRQISSGVDNMTMENIMNDFYGRY